jgi:prephenate dehydrogenase
MGLLGLGRFGRLTYDLLRPHVRLRVWTRDERKLDGLPEAATFEEAVASDIVVLTVAISAMEQTCRRMAPLLRPGQIVADTCSVKVRPAELMQTLLPESVELLATHPLFGPDSAKDGIQGLKIVLCPIRIGASAYEPIREALRAAGLDVIEATPEEHDRQAARTQAVFHLLGQAYRQLGWGRERIATPGPESLSRLLAALQHDTPQLFVDMQRENPFAAEERRRLIEALSALDRQISAGAA